MPKNSREDEPGSQGLSALVNNKKALKFIEEGGGGHLSKGPFLNYVEQNLPILLKTYLASVYFCKGKSTYH